MLWLGGCIEWAPAAPPQSGTLTCPFIRGSFLMPLLNGESSGGRGEVIEN